MPKTEQMDNPLDHNLIHLSLEQEGFANNNNNNKIPQPTTTFKHGNKFSYPTHFFSFFYSYTTFLAGRQSTKSTVFPCSCFLLKLDNMGRVVYSNTVTISQKKQCSLINTKSCYLLHPCSFISMKAILITN